MEIATKKQTIFWDLAEPMIHNAICEKGTMMGFPCLRKDKKFFASLNRNTNDLIVKLPAERVNDLIDNKLAQPFAPNGRVFREWAVIPELDATLWEQLMQEAMQFVDNL